MDPPSRVERSDFGETRDGRPVSHFHVANAHGLALRMLDHGAIVVAFETPDREGRRANINLGFPSLPGYLEEPPPYFGATVGRSCNRIAQARFVLDGQTIELAANDGRHHLHGGPGGFGSVHWDARPFTDDEAAGVVFRYRSPDGEEGYPGEVDVTARYALTERDELVVGFQATADRPTPVNLTNHCYWNLRGAGTGTIRDHVLELAADHYLPVDDERIPTGEVAPVAGTPMDFTRPRAIGARLDEVAADPVGYDHCYVLRGAPGHLRFAARVREPETGRGMEITTTQPGLQLYSGNFLDGSPQVNGYGPWTGFCLETQHFPDAPNRPAFPSTILRPGETYHHETVHRFFAE